MSIEVFNKIVNKKTETPDNDTEMLELKSIEEEKEELLKLLPEELRDRSVREEFSLEHIKKIIEFREKEGFKMVTGFHVSPRDIAIGSSLRVGQDGEVCFSTNIEKLYIGKGSGYIYAIECSEKFMKDLDTDLDWHTLKGEMKIVDKIKMTPENIKALGAGFAECAFS